MALPDFAVVILAAGKGTRLRSNLAKVLHPVGGRTLIEHVIRACQPLKPRLTVVVVGHQAEQVEAVIKPLGVRTLLQQPQRGTGHALLVARRALSGAKFAIILPGDAPLVRSETLLALARAHHQTGAAATILSAEVRNPAGYGRIVRRDDGTVAAIVEDSALTDDQRAIAEINSSIYAFTLPKLWPCLTRVRPENAHRELYLTDAVGLLRNEHETVLAQIAPDPEEILGCNTRADLAAVDQVLRRRKRTELMDLGVTIQMPESVVVDSDVTVGQDTVIEPGVRLLGKTRIGSGCLVGAGSILKDATLEDGVTVKPYSIVGSSRLDAGTQIGPFAHLRDGARLREKSKVGNFVEVKKSVLGEGVKAMHLTYLGDATIGRETNVGAGTITCNYDGVNKNPTMIGRRVFLGSDTALVAPVRVGDGAYVGAGSVITKNVPPGALGIARGLQVNKLGWANVRRRKMAAEARAPKRKAALGKKASRPKKTRVSRPTSRAALRAAKPRAKGRGKRRPAARHTARRSPRRARRR